MLNAFIGQVSKATGLAEGEAQAAIGIVLNAAERQGAPLADEIFERVPGARTLAAAMGNEVGAPTGVLARMIERTPGGRQAVVERLIQDLHAQGLGTQEIGCLFPAIGEFSESAFGVFGVGHLGDIFGALNAKESGVSSVA
jgi:hypothetical protein